MKSLSVSNYLQLRWRAFRRSPMLSTQIIGLLLGGFLVLYFSAIALALGFLAGELIHQEMGEDANVFNVASDFLLYVFGFDLLLRVVLQSSPRVDLRPLFILPVSKKKLLRMQNSRPFFERLQVLWLLMFTTFTIFNPGEGKWFWWLGAMCIPILNAYIISLWKSWNTEKPALAYPLLLILLSPVVIAGLDLLPMNEYWGNFHRAITLKYWPLLIYVVMIAVLIFTHSIMLRELAYKNPKGTAKATGGNLSFLESYGTTGAMINFRIKQIWRNKRLKRILLFSPFILLYGLIFLQPEDVAKGSLPTMVICIFMTGMGAIQFGQWAFPMDGREFSFYLTHGKMDEYIRDKALFLRIFVVVFTVVSSFYGFMNVELLIDIFTAGLFNYSVGIPFLLLISSYIKNSLSTNEGGAFNMQGADTVTFLTIIPIMVFPWLITMLPFGVYIMLGMGVLALFLQEPLLHWVSNKVKSRKYIMLTNYNKKD